MIAVRIYDHYLMGEFYYFQDCEIEGDGWMMVKINNGVT